MPSGLFRVKILCIATNKTRCHIVVATLWQHCGNLAGWLYGGCRTVVWWLCQGCSEIVLRLIFGDQISLCHSILATLSLRCGIVIVRKVSLTSQQRCYNVITKLWQSNFLTFKQPPSNVFTRLRQSYFLTFIQPPHNVATTLSQSYGKVIF